MNGLATRPTGRRTARATHPHIHAPASGAAPWRTRAAVPLCTVAAAATPVRPLRLPPAVAMP
eukprot:278095-Chlamydomonas_euryale.AAC.1